MDEWVTYLDAYERHLDEVSATLEHGRVTSNIFCATPPSTPMPPSLAPRVSALAKRGDEVAATIQSRMETISTVLRYSRMKDPTKVILIDVLA
ncbi:MAG: hypothetical protein ACYCTG_08580 [Ferrimicrobium sp.]